ncbi:MAG: phosphatase PAP2 family protein [Actinomycetota bacterium]|nr:phosphatase PAP2 family protein [Actinomycetota bacterium]
MDRTLYLDVNHFARQTPWAHAFMAPFALYGGVVVLALLLLGGWWRARSRSDVPNAVARSVWAGLGTAAAVGIAQPINHLVARPRPYVTLHHVEVLVPRAHDFTFPSDHATVAGASIVGLWLLRDRLMTILAVVDGLFLSFARVYVGAHYPGDVLGGLVVGAATIFLLWPVAGLILRPIVAAVARSPLRFLATASPSSRDRIAGASSP